jgi:predicted alpha/beta-fold hydrolase
MIPAEDLVRLAPSQHLTIVRTRHGGHCGFVERINAPSFADRFVVAQFDRFRRDAPMGRVHDARTARPIGE